jgi:hypothetical protein
MGRIVFTPEEGLALLKLQEELMAAKQTTANALRTHGAPLTGSVLQRLVDAERAEAAILRQINAILACRAST